MLQVGDKAPEFTLFSESKKEVSLSDYQGRNVVLLFFPMAFTSVCTAELCEARDNIAMYNNLNAEVIAISVDSIFTQAKEEQQFNFTLLADFNKEVSKSYGTLYENFVFGMKGVSKRSAFVIDGQGIIRYVEVLESAGDLPNFQEVKNTLNSLQ